MKKFTCMCCIFLLCSTSSISEAGDSIQDWAEETDHLWRTGTGAHDGSSTAISASMIGWGVGLALAIGILAAVLHQSDASHN